MVCLATGCAETMRLIFESKNWPLTDLFEKPNHNIVNELDGSYRTNFV